MFKTVKLGKATFGEVSSSFNTVATLTKQSVPIAFFLDKEAALKSASSGESFRLWD